MALGPRVVALAVPLLLAGCTGLPIEWPSAPPTASPAPAAGAVGPVERELAEFALLADEYRRAKGCRAIVWHDAAARVAQAHSADMGRRGYFSHVNPEGRSPFDRLRAARVSYQRAAENIASGQTTARLVLASWIGSPSHRVSLENCAYTHHGVGFDGRNWTHVLLTPR